MGREFTPETLAEEVLLQFPKDLEEHNVVLRATRYLRDLLKTTASISIRGRCLVDVDNVDQLIANEQRTLQYNHCDTILRRHFDLVAANRAKGKEPFDEMVKLQLAHDGGYVEGSTDSKGIIRPIFTKLISVDKYSPYHIYADDKLMKLILMMFNYSWHFRYTSIEMEYCDITGCPGYIIGIQETPEIRGLPLYWGMFIEPLLVELHSEKKNKWKT